MTSPDPHNPPCGRYEHPPPAEKLLLAEKHVAGSRPTCEIGIRVRLLPKAKLLTTAYIYLANQTINRHQVLTPCGEKSQHSLHGNSLVEKCCGKFDGAERHVWMIANSFTKENEVGVLPWREAEKAPPHPAGTTKTQSSKASPLGKTMGVSAKGAEHG